MATMMPNDATGDDGGGAKHGHSADRAYSRIRNGLLQDEWPTGARLLEVELAQRIGVSRTPVREALRRLVNEGFLEYVTNVGCRVRGWSRADIASLYDLRIELEAYAARRAAARISAADRARLRTLCQEMETVVATCGSDLARRDGLTPLNETFHSTIIDAAGNEHLKPLIANVTSAPVVLRTFRRYSGEEVARSMGHHRELVAALDQGNSDWAGAIMRSHIHAGYLAVVREWTGSEAEDCAAPDLSGNGNGADN